MMYVLMMLRCYQSSPGDRNQHQKFQISLKVEAFQASIKTTKIRDRRGSVDGERERESESVLKDTRTSPQSHMVVEMVLYGCVCLSVPFRIFTGKARRQAVCNNIPPILCSISLLFFFFVLVTIAILEIRLQMSL